MMASWESRKTLVRRLRVRGRGLDPVLARLRLATLLSGAHLSPAGLAPSAILCVRRLRGPAPGSLSPRAAGEILSPAWERAVAASLGELARRAARPAHEAVPASAEAVLFADQAELLACFVNDCCNGSAAASWWWQTLFRGADVTPVRALLDAPAYIPAALEHLARRGKAVVFARTLGKGEARALLLSVVRIFALAQLEAALDVSRDEVELGVSSDVSSDVAFDAARRGAVETDREEALGASSRRGRDAAPTFEDSTAREDSTTRRAPWHTAVPEVAVLAPEQQTLLGVSLMLMRAPRIVRTQAFARNTRRWLLEAVASFDDAPAVAQVRPLADQAFARHRKAQAPRAAEREESSAVAPFAEPTLGIVSSEVEADASVEGLHAMGVETVKLLESSPVEATRDARVLSETDRASTFQSSESDVESSPSGFVDDEHVEPDAARGWSEESAQSFEATDTTHVHTAYVETQLGGIFYLINLALFLELYGDFTRPAAPGLPLSPWDFLALAGAELAGASFQTDPLRALLEQLAWRGYGEAPGAGFLPPDEWRMSAAWLEPFAEHVRLEWTARDGRLRVRHPEGFLLLDLPVQRKDARARLALETGAYRNHLSFELRHERAPHRTNDVRETDALKRWLDWLMPYARARLRRALGLAACEDLSRILCEKAARVLASATHVDVFFSLADLPVEVRLSGIDRDPGWVPAAGRFIAFHYE